MPTTLILTCEHAVNEIPARCRHLFRASEEVLFTHKAIDFGALQLAQYLAAELGLALYYSCVSRLLVEANRSPENEELFSAYTQGLLPEKKKQVLGTYYFPHRLQVEEAVGKEIAVGNQVVHFAIHSFTPAMDGEVRKADIGILFDPKRKSEKALAILYKSGLLLQDPNLKVQYNAPYPGTADGLPSHLRKLFLDEHYAGFELEVNQRFYLNGETEVWQNLMKAVTSAFRISVMEMNKNPVAAKQAKNKK
ncbi:putative N-formylglutamate amidohydrolase [Pontibacter aydingkolensis]|uniref:N-formylglutamate amidohydrolase n=1 Tax=Pontibacter aydingkolensis TaxID=1911536 RepID=A0ABS7CVC0_9BACT|nr:N-formylglutamate amidohydrolase [Pontibacter aydingkolensis]MBW7467785.1 N-formylglutamate amidohydrolase [Pontibacter aydingkolensis]